MPNDFTRNPSAERFEFLGMKTNDAPDAFPPGKFPLAINVRGVSDNSTQTRPGFPQLFTSGSPTPITDLRGYAALFTDNLPRILTIDTNGFVFLDTGANVGNLAVASPSASGASMIPFRPNESPQPWMYIANGSDYQKFSSPVNNVVTQRKAGIAEPQAAPDAAPQENFINLIGAPGYTNSGTAGAPSSSNRVNDTAGTVLQDPTGAALWTVQVGTAAAYQKLQTVLINSNQFMVMDVFAVLPNSLTIQSIFYFSGSTGRCVIVPAGIASEGGGTIFKDTLLTTFRRGTMIVVGSEKCYVWSVSEGPNGGISIETSTTGTHTTADALTTVSAISVISGTPTTQSLTGTATLAVDAGGPNPAWSAGFPSIVSVSAAAGESNNLKITGFGMAIPSNATVLGIAFTVQWAVSGAHDVGDNNVVRIKGGSLGGPNHSALNNGVFPYTYGSNIDLWGTTWTPTDINNNAGFGVSLGASNFGTNNRSFQITGATVQVFFSTPSGGTPTPPVAGQAITDPDTTYQVTTGVGTMTSVTVPANPFNLSGASFQTEDYISLGIKIDTLANLTELKFLLDVGDASFTQNFYYYTIRPSDITNAVTNVAASVTQLAAAQTTAQRAGVDAEVAAISAQAGFIDTTSGAQLLPGSSQWTQIVFPISALTRVGNDQTKSLQTLQKIQFLWNASGTINVATDLAFVFGGYQPDVGDIGAPLQYRVRPRARSTGVVGNPSPASRYGVNPRRGQVTVYLPSAAYDPQIDTWDVFRYGGATTEWRFIGSTPVGSPTFIDNFDDAAAQAGDALDFDNFEPWPSVDVPNVGTASVVNGTVAVVSTPDTDITSYLPGTLVQLGGLNVYTLWARPTLISGMNYLLQFVENAGAGTNVSYIIQEPFIANRQLPYMWGPDANGTVFACGDEFRPGNLYFSKNYAPDSAPDTYNQEIVQPAEPLLGGETVDGLAFTASSERWWALYPQPDNPSQRYNVVQQPVPRGLAAPFGHCTDGRAIYFWAKDGIWSTADGSLTEADLHTLFPHEGVKGVPFIYAGVTIQPPDYSRTAGFRLTHTNGYLHAIYLDAAGVYHTLVCDLRRKAWSLDLYGSGMSVTAAYHPEQQAGTVLTETARYPELIVAFQNVPVIGTAVGVETDLANDILNTPIVCVLATREDSGGDLRASKQWGDYFVDAVPAATPNGVTVTPMSLGTAVAPATLIPTSPTSMRVRSPASVGGIVVSDFMGLLFTWIDDFSRQTTWTKLRIWQLSYAVQPAAAVQWATFGTSFGLDGYMHIQRLSLAYVSTAPIIVQVTSYDGQSPAAIILPSTGGVFQKTYFPLAANKGQLFKISMTSSQKFQIFSEDCEVYVGAWGRRGPYITPQKFGGSFVQPSPI